MMAREQLMLRAIHAMQYSYSPYSGFRVGAAFETEDGEIIEGCNVENASYGVTNCAERTALFRAVASGHTKFIQLAIAGGLNGNITDYTYPCGVCRQAIAEFCSPDFPIHLYNGDGYRTCLLKELLPCSFTGESIK